MNWLKYKKIYFSISGLMILISIFSLLKWGFRFGVDFRGGSVLEYKYDQSISTEELTRLLQDNDIEVTAIQSTDDNVYLIKLPSVDEIKRKQIASVAGSLVSDPLDATPSANIDELRFENVGPTIGPELVKKTIYAMLIAAMGILLWIAYQFKSVKFGIAAIIATLHDTFILIGSFSILGHLFGAEVDFLFVTALLTTMSFSVHDTIVVFDRVREIGKKESLDLEKIGNKALTETMVRSLNNSFTIIFMLVALLLLGGTSIRWFAAALLIGTILGTYSSPFVAVPLMVTWDSLIINLKRLKLKFSGRRI